MHDLAAELRRTLEHAKPGDRVVSIHLFGIEHAEGLKGANLKTLAERAGISASFGTELRKAIRLGEYVRIESKPSSALILGGVSA